ncbi:unnamed protein product [Trichogramma brassicae]|uniref:Uncharacterized protein n=1 Tax=Trichogramma brassicae TaxID=86971 RepID=A0A6H5I2K3_9HYME|nr:unnamed protein product [Trichogramma brassicae]
MSTRAIVRYISALSPKRRAALNLPNLMIQIQASDIFFELETTVAAIMMHIVKFSPFSMEEAALCTVRCREKCCRPKNEVETNHVLFKNTMKNENPEHLSPLGPIPLNFQGLKVGFSCYEDILDDFAVAHSYINAHNRRREIESRDLVRRSSRKVVDREARDKKKPLLHAQDFSAANPRIFLLPLKKEKKRSKGAIYTHTHTAARNNLKVISRVRTRQLRGCRRHRRRRLTLCRARAPAVHRKLHMPSGSSQLPVGRRAYHDRFDISIICFGIMNNLPRVGSYFCPRRLWAEAQRIDPRTIAQPLGQHGGHWRDT